VEKYPYVPERAAQHPNTVRDIEGIVFDLELDSLEAFRQLAEEQLTNSTFWIGEIKVWSREVLEGFELGHNKLFPLAAVILRAEKLDYFPAGTQGVRRCSFMGHSAVYITTNSCS